MNPFLNMEKHKEEFTQNDMRIYQAILEQPERVISLSTSRFAEEINVSQPALTRFIKVLGYQRYNDFRSDITAFSATLNQMSQSDSLPYFDRLRILLSETEKVLSDQYLNELADYILSASRIFTTGMGKSLQPAHLLQSLLRKYGIFVNAVPLDELIETADSLTTDELLIIFSVSANKDLMQRITNSDARIMLVTTNAGHPYANKIDKTVLLPYLPPDPETSSVSPILFDILVELIDSYIAPKIMEKK